MDTVGNQPAVQSEPGSLDVGDEEPAPMSVICYKINGDFLTSSR